MTQQSKPPPLHPLAKLAALLLLILIGWIIVGGLIWVGTLVWSEVFQ